MDCRNPSTSMTSSRTRDLRFAVSNLDQLRKRHVRQREQVVLTKRPFTTIKLFTMALLKHLGSFWAYAAANRLMFGLLSLLWPFSWLILSTFDRPHEKILGEFLAYFRYILWWVGLGVASSIGFGSGLHTFVLYLGPHIAMFTFKATLCGREDFKKAPYDTDQYGIRSTWANRDCLDIGAPRYSRLDLEYDNYMVPLHKILLQVQPEAILWGIGTAIGELPPYFISKAARLSGERLKELEDNVNNEQESSNIFSVYPNKLKRWMVTHVHQLGFVTVLIFASIPNPLFDLAGIICGHFLVPFWKFFFATLIGKALIKTHIQTVFIILVCNSHTLNVLETVLGWLLLHVPGFNHIVPWILSVLNKAKNNFHQGKHVVSKPGRFSAASVWNTVVILMLVGYLGSIITSTAQGFLIQKQKNELKALEAQLKRSNGPWVEESELQRAK